MRIAAPRRLLGLSAVFALVLPAGSALAGEPVYGPPDRVQHPSAPGPIRQQPVFDVHELRLPASSTWALPPMINLRASTASAANRVVLRRRVLRSSHLLLAPAARRAVRANTVTGSALALLASVPKLGAPLLVFSASGRDLRVQATTQWMTRRALQSLASLSEKRRPASLTLRAAESSLGDRAAPHGGLLGAQAVAIAERYLGIPYVWGSADPHVGLDCSGLTMLVYRKLGVPLDHYAAFQFLEGERIPPDQLQAGDLVFFHMKTDGPGHVGMYIGSGRFIQAPHTGDFVKISALQDYASAYVGAVRPY